MTTRDPRSRPSKPEAGAREPTQSINIEPESNPSLALGTHEDRTERTKVESPSGRTRPPPMPQKSSDDPELNIDRVLGSYRLVELLGKGGMGYVYRAEHVKLGREVALKLLRLDYAKRRDAVLRFFQEAKTVNRVRHRNIVDVTDFVELDDGTTFIIMELLSGQSLGKWARTGIDLPRALAVLVQICDGLGAAHAVGVVHRDLKPDNVIVVPTSDGAELVKLLDFGVAKLLNRDDEDIGFQTAAGSVIGTPAYMSPEQAGGMQIDHRSDIYSLGAIMYELFCGQPMFKGRSFGEFVRKHLTEMPVPPRQTQGGATMDDRLEALILKALAKDPNERFGSIIELRDGLLQLLGGLETHPPGYIQTLTSSAVRPLTTQHPPLPPSALPLPPPAMATTVPTPPHQMSTMHASSQVMHPSSVIQSQMWGYAPATQDPAPPTPLWVWLIGGSFAIGLGIVAAVWYANRTSEPAPTPEPAVQPAVGPSATPIETPVQKPRFVELHFDSLPPAGVYALGKATELCRTPCSYNVDLQDGGAPDRRTFVVRAEHYVEQTIDVDLAGTQRNFQTTLEREPTIPVTHTEPVDEPADRPTNPNKKTGNKGVKKGAKGADKTPDPVADKKPDPVADKKPDPISDKKPDPILDKKPGAIDPADTLDPFHRKK